MEQINNHLLHTKGVDLDDHFLGQGGKFDFDLSEFGLPRQYLDCVLHYPIQGHFFVLRHEHLIFDHALIQKQLYLLQQKLRRHEDQLCVFALFGVFELVLQVVGKANNAPERGHHLVRDAGGE